MVCRKNLLLAHPSDKAEGLGPVDPVNRLCGVDILRGFAVFAMVLWNFRSGSIGSYQDVGIVDHVVERLIAFLDFENTAHLIFAFLFGWGFAMQMRSKEKPIAVYLRRLCSLFILGVAHCFFWYRPDFIHIYAYLGVSLFFFSKLPGSVLLMSAVVLMGVPAIGGIVLGKLIPADYIYGGGFYRSLRPENIMILGYVDLVLMRMGEFAREKLFLQGYLRNMDILSSFLLGLYAFRRGVFQKPLRNKKLLCAVLWTSLAVAVAGDIWVVLLRSAVGFESHESELYRRIYNWLSLQDRPDVTGALVKLYSSQALTLFYISSLSLLIEGGKLKRLFMPLSPVGRMAMSNYFFHSLAGTTIFYGYGLGLYGKIGSAVGLMVAIAIFGFQTAASRWWLTRFRFGPIEWLWRSLSYWRVQPMASSYS